MTFRTAIERTRHLEEAWRPGLQALRAEDRPHVEIEDTRRLRGSADVDGAMRGVEPNSHRWDFAIAYQHANRKNEFVYWVELHTASDSQVRVVIKKAQWLLRWLTSASNPLNKFEREIIWISSGATTFTLTAPKKKLMAAVGLMHKGSKLKISNQRPL